MPGLLVPARSATIPTQKQKGPRRGFLLPRVETARLFQKVTTSSRSSWLLYHAARVIEFDAGFAPGNWQTALGFYTDTD